MLFTQKRQFKIIVELDCENSIKGKEEIEETVKALGYSVLEVKHQPQTRSTLQNNALHKYLTQWAELLNENGIDMRMVVRQQFRISPTMQLLKDEVWKRAQKTMFGIDSTTKINTIQINAIVDVITKAFGESYGLYVPFPCKEEMENQAINNLRR